MRPTSRWGMLALLSAAELMGMSLWFAATAVGPQLAQRWQLSSAQAAWLTAIVVSALSLLLIVVTLFPHILSR